MLRGDEAKQKCPDIIIFNVPEKRGKADLTKYRLAGAEVSHCISHTSTTYFICTYSTWRLLIRMYTYMNSAYLHQGFFQDLFTVGGGAI